VIVKTKLMTKKRTRNLMISEQKMSKMKRDVKSVKTSRRSCSSQRHMQTFVM